MKNIIQGIIGGSVKWLASALVALGTAYFAIETWVDDKVQAAENRVKEIRGLDMSHLDKRFNTLERALYGKVVTPEAEQFMPKDGQ